MRKNRDILLFRGRDGAAVLALCAVLALAPSLRAVLALAPPARPGSHRPPSIREFS